jgi:hypothetical protein
MIFGRNKPIVIGAFANSDSKTGPKRVYRVDDNDRVNRWTPSHPAANRIKHRKRPIAYTNAATDGQTAGRAVSGDAVASTGGVGANEAAIANESAGTTGASASCPW